MTRKAKVETEEFEEEEWNEAYPKKKRSGVKKQKTLGYGGPAGFSPDGFSAFPGAMSGRNVFSNEKPKAFSERPPGW